MLRKTAKKEARSVNVSRSENGSLHVTGVSVKTIQKDMLHLALITRVAALGRRTGFYNENTDKIIPRIQKRIQVETATEMEKKILYGYLLEKGDLL